MDQTQIKEAAKTELNRIAARINALDKFRDPKCQSLVRRLKARKLALQSIVGTGWTQR